MCKCNHEVSWGGGGGHKNAITFAEPYTRNEPSFVSNALNTTENIPCPLALFCDAMHRKDYVLNSYCKFC